jgi:hypothetical protein
MAWILNISLDEHYTVKVIYLQGLPQESPLIASVNPQEVLGKVRQRGGNTNYLWSTLSGQAFSCDPEQLE